MPQDIICLQETWGNPDSNDSFNHLFGRESSVLSRNGERGGGSLILLKRNLKIHSTFAVNKDTSLSRIVLNSNKILWLGNIYLNKGKINQIQKLFKTLKSIIPPHEWNRVVLIGDFNVNLNTQSDPRCHLIKALSKELGLIVHYPPDNTFKSSKIDFAIVSKKLEGSLSVFHQTLSDHYPVILKIKPPFCDHKLNRILLPNRKLAESISLRSLTSANNSQEWISNHYSLLLSNSGRILKHLERRDYDRNSSTF